eukprot:15278539-Alexandrium_andersonii.AAC.1
MASRQNELVRKPARWASSAPELLRRLGLRCSNEGWSSDDPRRRLRVPLGGQLAWGENRAARAA